jgi:hypothetical protein
MGYSAKGLPMKLSLNLLVSCGGGVSPLGFVKYNASKWHWTHRSTVGLEIPVSF